jgi:hypothetical protein
MASLDSDRDTGPCGASECESLGLDCDATATPPNPISISDPPYRNSRSLHFSRRRIRKSTSSLSASRRKSRRAANRNTPTHCHIQQSNPGQPDNISAPLLSSPPTFIAVSPHTFAVNLRYRLLKVCCRGGTKAIDGMKLSLTGWCPYLFDVVFGPFESFQNPTMKIQHGWNLPPHRPAVSLQLAIDSANSATSRLNAGKTAVYRKVYHVKFSRQTPLNNWCNFHELSDNATGACVNLRRSQHPNAAKLWRFCYELTCVCYVDLSRKSPSQVNLNSAIRLMHLLFCRMLLHL